jgi:hypothetical protein
MGKSGYFPGVRRPRRAADRSPNSPHAVLIRGNFTVNLLVFSLCVTRRFNAMPESVRYWPLPWVNWGQSSCPHLYIKISFSTATPFRPMFPKCLVSSFRFFRLTFCYAPRYISRSRACDISCPSYPLCFDQRNIASWEKQNKNLFITLFPASVLPLVPPHCLLRHSTYVLPWQWHLLSAQI